MLPKTNCISSKKNPKD